MSHNDIVTQVTPADNSFSHAQDEIMEDYNTEIRMNMRGHMFTITRDDLMGLPESILLCLFPNGIFVDIDGNVISNLTEDDIVYVNFSPECFQYICRIFDTAVRDLHIMNQLQQQQYFDINDPNILNDRPSIIVLREDLDYYCIPPVKNLSVENMRHIKYLVGHKLLENQNIFEGLGFVAGKQLRPAEQHLMDMLCSSGFSTDGEWGHRSLEPGKTVIFSLTLARLNNGSSLHITPSDSPQLAPSSSNVSLSSEKEERGRHKEKKKSRLSTLAQSLSRAGSKVRQKANPNNTKLLLFWRKPARKCWWTDNVVTVDIGDIGIKDSNGEIITNTKIKVHIRRVWTLELSIIGLQ
ncbi:hypothetical protein C6P40_001072 [Pichia californica]|uniref:Growth regulation protein n=1 Tax=Pichia californica TaxID=460514 RepID=A0A9P6WLP6_9ASCO|nr:hypothetical protein C6P42_005402 [[Candida] californica]KAG0688348.1 hypothetical protein C6P40_001072 [[Candida] californica]